MKKYSVIPSLPSWLKILLVQGELSMKPISHFRIYISILALVLSSLACGVFQSKATPTRTPTAKAVSTKVSTKAPEPTNPPVNSAKLIHQWATTGEASSEYGSTSWTALQAGGAPDTPDCGDAGTAWASAQSDTVESITVYFMDQPLIPSEINIIQSYNPSQVVQVELIDAYAEHSDATIYEAEPKATGKCPYTLSIKVMGIDYPVMGIRIIVDQSVLGLGWNEIDAVELVGYSIDGTTTTTQPAVSGLPAGEWDDVYALPIFPSADYVNYVDEDIVLYGVSKSDRQEVLGFILDDLQGSGWHLDVDQNGKCLVGDSCASKLAGLDYSSATNEIWYFIHRDSPDAHLALTLVETDGVVSVTMSLK
jgi:hypothetical protein